MVPLGELTGGTVYSSAHGVSANGLVIVGQSSSAAGFEAFRWTIGGGMAGLGDLPGGTFGSIANAASATGSVVVGQGTSAAGTEAFMWTISGGTVSLKDYLVGQGASNLSGWTLTNARGISADGLTIVGHGINPLGQTEGWIVTIPEPSSGVMAILACGLFWRLGRRFK